MIIKPKFQDQKQPQQVDESKKRSALLDNPMKVIVLAIQAFLLACQIYYFVTDKTYESKNANARIVMIVLSLLIFAAFLYEKKFIMKAYIFSLVLLSAIPIAAIEITLAGILQAWIYEEDNSKLLNDVNGTFCGVIFILCFLLILMVYIGMCCVLLGDIYLDIEYEKKANGLPYTTQDSNLVQSKKITAQSQAI